ncbi:hypothetical protein PHLGIDRAFT_19771 [Phlebiopsis gigantea 11061_1 CR5-6]|uniref:Uncharacterized protein n=1 Tax=Phlebiopsis gigantea (strain 11061_1 CR5-6) TaxID=745531 RepID=A0A0C3PHA0_PHLG1|nr:hypothetical protein PHLGIDRAFT_19771 [Phlebiopsis gigantea 11061_1 CR5-6]
MLIPQGFILRPLLSLIGFGPFGPIKGSTAAWAQRRFWGAAVAKGSWFSVLQRAGMTLGLSWWQWIKVMSVAVMAWFWKLFH